MASLSLAIDLGLGQPLENFLRSCLLAVRLGEVAGFNEQNLVEAYYLALLRFVGCTAETQQAVAIFGDEVAATTWLMGVEHGNSVEMLAALLPLSWLFRSSGPPQFLGQIFRNLYTLKLSSKIFHYS
jgi:hypothetical protein